MIFFDQEKVTFFFWNMNSSSFVELRNLISSFESQDDVNNNLMQSMSLISQVSKNFIDISANKCNLTNSLLSISKQAKTLQMRCENNLYECHIGNEELKNVHIHHIDLNDPNLNILDKEEFIRLTNMTEEQVSLMSPNQFNKQRLQYEKQRFEKIKRQFQEANSRSVELKAKLSQVNKMFAPIMTKLKDIDEVITDFLDKQTKEEN